MKWILNRIRRLTAVVPNADKRIYRCPERVARALQQEMGTAPFDEATSFALARAAIAAMREPTEEMTDAWSRAPGAIKEGWQAMIDAALEGK